MQTNEKAAMPASTAANPQKNGENSCLNFTLFPSNCQGGAVMSDSHPGYYAVIPADVRYDDRIPANAKLLYGEIAALISAEGYCYASNDYFSSVYQLSERTVSGLISKLQKHGYIFIEFEKNPQSGLMSNRRIYIKVSSCDARPVENIFYPPRKYFQEGVEENFQHTNLSNTDICKENKKESAEKNKRKTQNPPKEDFDPLPLFTSWIAGCFPDRDPQEKNALYLALRRFRDNRVAIKKPMKSQGAVTALTNKLKKYADCDLPAMIDLLDTATLNGWQSVFPPKEVAAPVKAPAQSGREKEWL